MNSDSYKKLLSEYKRFVLILEKGAKIPPPPPLQNYHTYCIVT